MFRMFVCGKTSWPDGVAQILTCCPDFQKEKNIRPPFTTSRLGINNKNLGKQATLQMPILIQVLEDINVFLGLVIRQPMPHHPFDDLRPITNHTEMVFRSSPVKSAGTGDQTDPNWFFLGPADQF